MVRMTSGCGAQQRSFMLGRRQLGGTISPFVSEQNGGSSLTRQVSHLPLSISPGRPDVSHPSAASYIPALTCQSITNPSTGKVIVAIPEGMPADVDVAVKAAHKAFTTTWGTNCPGFQRGEFLIKIAELMERDIDILASLEALDNGKTFAIAKAFDVCPGRRRVG